MPVRRPRGKDKSAVMAIQSELDAWLARSPLRSCGNASPAHKALPAVASKVLVMEDSVKDLNTCVSVLRAIGVSQLDAISNVPAALLRLEEIAGGKLCQPDVIILDLAFPLESGFEILRYLKSTPALRSIPVVVWTAMGCAEEQICTVFGVRKVVPKWAGTSELEAAVRAAAAS